MNKSNTVNYSQIKQARSRLNSQKISPEDLDEMYPHSIIDDNPKFQDELTPKESGIGLIIGILIMLGIASSFFFTN